MQPPGETGRRYYVPPASATGPTSRPELSALEMIRPGDEVAVVWSGDPKRMIQSIRLIRRAAEEPAAATPQPEPARPAAPVAAAAEPAVVPTVAAGTSASEQANALIDDAVAFANRLLELPIYALLGVAVFAGIVVLMYSRRLDHLDRPRAARRMRWMLFVIGLFYVFVVLDRKLANLQAQMNALRQEMGERKLADLNQHAATPAAATTTDKTYLFDLATAQSAMEKTFKSVTLRPAVYDAATNVVQIQIGDPLVKAFLAVIDLKNPQVEIRLGTTVDKKRLTTAFAKENDCTVAINGEAGQSPAMNSGFGPWRGHMVYRGQVISEEQPGNPRPFLSFDAGNHAAYRPQVAADRSLPANVPNVIWGRLDAVVSGVVQTADERFRQPRTAMGVSQDGTKLFLLVIDGRQPRYSTGMTRAEVGHTLKAFGAYDGMLCDEGGSSCIYLKQFGGIANIPSDNAGTERPTYTHFGITLKARMN
ncbi:MAG: phosphodiester glycosidase family protein [Tepidisphaeraceae bacterium]